MSAAGKPSRVPSCRFRAHHGHRVLSLLGELDISVRDAVDRDLRDHIEAIRSSVIIVDLSAVTFMDSSGLDPLLRVHGELAELERVLALQSISGPVNSLFRLLAGMGLEGLVRQTLRGSRTPLGARPEADDFEDRDPPRPGNGAGDLQAEMRAHANVGEATGVLMAVHDCNAEQAGLLLELVAHHRDVTVADLAAGIVAAADATRSNAPGVGLAATVPAGVRAALSTRVPSPRAAPGSSA
jgi:stage II sporulation protein AA (anti-sigma F factor antagonist)